MRGLEAEETWVSIFPLEQRRYWETVSRTIKNITEIRLRANRPIFVYSDGRELLLDHSGGFPGEEGREKRTTYEEIQQLIDYLCRDSRYAYGEELRRGYFTAPGGHRIGVVGELVTDSEGRVRVLKHIAGVNIRIARQVLSAGKKVQPYLYRNGGIENTLIISPPGCGKTTLLRDLIRRISDGSGSYQGRTVGVVDERGEIAACYQGVPQLQVGARTDVLDNCPKQHGMTMLLRSMSPQVIAVDELGSREDAATVSEMAGCGCSILATIHGNSVEDIRKKEMFRLLFHEEVFTNFLLLEKEKGVYHVSRQRIGEEQICCIS